MKSSRGASRSDRTVHGRIQFHAPKYEAKSLAVRHRSADSPAAGRRVCRARRRDNGRQRGAMSGPLAGIEIQPILLDRIERYRARHCIATLGDAVERLVRLGVVHRRDA